MRIDPTVAARMAAGIAFLVSMVGAQADEMCAARHTSPILPADPSVCAELRETVRKPDGKALATYEEALGRYLRNYCHRDAASGWVSDKTLRDTGPFISIFRDGAWEGQERGTHAAVVIWYSPEMATWIRANRSAVDDGTGPDSAPVPDGAIMVKEMYPGPAERCAVDDPATLRPASGAAVMVRATEMSHDGWFWGWFGWPGEGWIPDWPADPATNRLPYMGFGQYCVNCHASARDNSTFAAARNIKGEPGEPISFLVQDEALFANEPAHHADMVSPDEETPQTGNDPLSAYLDGFLAAFPRNDAPAPDRKDVRSMASRTYDNVWMPSTPPEGHGPFLTSDQCIGCHDAGSTGLHFDMTSPDAGTGKLTNMSPYATWLTSPMGLAGRDPIFFSQLASESQSFHPDEVELVETTCFGCHGVLGQRQLQIENKAAGRDCDWLRRPQVDAVPWPADNPHVEDAEYGALARDGVSCMACHQMALGTQAEADAAQTPRNACVDDRRQALNPGASGFAKNFTGSFLVGPGGQVNGPFAGPKTAPMDAAIGVTPVHEPTVASAEMCGTCHTVHLPVLHRGKTVARVYEQTTYAEWAFSAHRTGKSPYGDLPGGAGASPTPCVDCHMPAGQPAASKIASIQEHSNFPAADFTRPADDIDLPVREGYSPHVLVGLNLFLVRMARQFPDILGLRREDPMLGSKGINPAVMSERQILENARSYAAAVDVRDVRLDGESLRASVRVTNKTGHKFPSGVGFRRAFLTFEVLDAGGKVLWASGRTDGIGRLVDRAGAALPGEDWWGPACKARIEPDARLHQPHHQTISAEAEVQIYQELVAAPPDRDDVSCGHDAPPEGALTTSFLSICAEVKDNRLLPEGYLPLETRKSIATALGADEALAEDAGTTAVGGDPDYRSGGGDSLVYLVRRGDIDGRPASVRARLYYQATPPFYLQDRFCTAKGTDTDRLYYLAGHLDLSDTPADGWKLLVGDSGPVPVSR